MSRRVNILPAGYESDEEYDEFGDRNIKNVHCMTPVKENFQITLQNACINNNIPEINRALESKSVNINDYLCDNWTALMRAASNGSYDAIVHLLNYGADPLIEFDCHNIIMCICNSKYASNEEDLLKCLKLIVNLDIFNINAKDRTGLSALMYACSSGWLKLVEFLIDRGADIELTDNLNGETALFYAVRSRHVNIVKFLLSHGANKDATDNKSQTVHRIAENKCMTDILNLLNTSNDLKLEVYYSEDSTYWNLVMNELKNGFQKDVQIFLESLSMEAYVNNINSNNITFKKILTGNNETFINMGFVLSPHRHCLTTALKHFHLWNWNKYCIDVNKNEMNAEKVAQNLASVIRQLHILDASLIYLGVHSNDLDPLKGQEAMKYLTYIRNTEEKIFQLLGERVRVDPADYIGPFKLRYRNVKISTMDKVFFTAAVVLALLRIV